MVASLVSVDPFGDRSHPGSGAAAIVLVAFLVSFRAEEGRVSFDAVVCTCAFAALVVIGTRPFGLDDPGSIWGTVLTVALVVGVAVVAFAKGRVLLGVIGLFVPVVGLVGAIRLARPGSPWARRRYDGERLARAQARFAATRSAQRLRRRIGDAIAGEPSEPVPQPESTDDPWMPRRRRPRLWTIGRAFAG